MLVGIVALIAGSAQTSALGVHAAAAPAPTVTATAPTPTVTTTAATPTVAATAAPTVTTQPAAGSPERQMFDVLNAERIRQGLTPVAWSSELGTAAGRHSADMAANGFLDHYGSDGADQQQRAARAGYIVPPGSGWMVIEAVSGMPGVEASFGWLTSDAQHRNILLRSVWREVGIGYVPGGTGAYWTLDFGCRPNVLPVFLDGSADGKILSLTFTNENCASYGGGPEQMGRATEVVVSSYSDFRDGIWEPFVDSKQLARPSTRGLDVRLRDPSGRMSAPVWLALDTVPSSGSTTAAPSATPTPIPTIKPTATSTGSPTPTARPTATFTPTSTRTPSPVPTDTPDEEATPG